MVSLAVFIILAVAVVILLVFKSSNRNQAYYAKIPGPSGWPIIGSTLEGLSSSQEILQKIICWTAKYGPVLVVQGCGVTKVLITGPKEIQALLTCKQNISKDTSYKFIHPWLGTGLLTSTGSKWNSRRRLLTPAFHYNFLEDFVHVFNANSAILVEKLGQQFQDVYVDLREHVALCALDIICDTVMGTSVNAQKGGAIKYVRAVTRMSELFLYRHFRPWYYADFIFRLSSSGREQTEVVKVLNNFSSKIIKTKRAALNEKHRVQQYIQNGNDIHKSFLDLLLEMTYLDESWTEDDLREEINTFMFAGHDTTAAAISWALFLLAVHQDVQDKVVTEQFNIFGSDDRQPTMADLMKMKYLDQVTKEALRLYPSVPVISRVIDTDIQIGKYTIPSGTNVAISPYVLHRNQEIYPDPEKFDPERFTPEQINARHPFAYIPFSAGPRNCIGQKFAKLEEKSVLAAICRNFKIDTLDTMEKIKASPDIVLKPHQPIRLKLSRRM